MNEPNAVLERQLLIAATAMVVAGLVLAAVHETMDGPARLMGVGGLGTAIVAALSYGLKRYAAATPGRLPASIGRTQVRIRPSRTFALAGITVALVMPLAAIVALLVVLDWVWILLAVIVVLGVVGIRVTATDRLAERTYWMGSNRAEQILQRLCIAADLVVPAVVVEQDVVANAWTEQNRIHLTTTLLELLDDRELEAVLAHEVAHLARRDAAAMEVCSGPSRLLLTFGRYLSSRLNSWTGVMADWGGSHGLFAAIGLWLFAAVTVPPALVVGGIARLSVLGLSRSREYAADQAAATLTGHPSALASALLKLEAQDTWAPTQDLRVAHRDGVLCIVAEARSSFGRVVSTHPPTARRVERLQALGERVG